MQMKVTESDKRLLSFLACVLILVGFGWYLLRPAEARIEETVDLIDQAQMEKKEMDISMAMYPDYQQEFAEGQQRAAEATREYYDRMASQEVDREITNIVLDNKLECISLVIDPLVYTEETPYVRSQLAQEELLAAAESGTSEEDNRQDQIFTCRVRLTVEGEEEQYQRLIDLFVNDYPSIRVTGLSYTENRSRMVVQEDGSSVRVAGDRRLTMNMNLYMCDKSLYEHADQNSANPLEELANRLFQSFQGGGIAQTEDIAPAQGAAGLENVEPAETQRAAEGETEA